ncbi:TonB-dependent receptor [Halosquirtibacter xylanolyticus]|uniref:TonB-dependent receptor n=1 Tax=Halosquirtibacter xylanolyticus TaxID=3374599 RepID=UPI00374A8F98|nr:TonB-dependent receptor [Prolixibacteraceae bacterium]
MSKLLYIIAIILFMIEGAYAQKKITIVDQESKSAIPFTTLYNTDNRQGFVTDVYGNVTLPENAENSKLQISSMGYESKIIVVKQIEDGETISLVPSHLKIDEVVVSGTTPSLQKQEVMNVAYLKMKDATVQNSLSETISNIPGVQQVTTGAAIGKPTIRGLSGSRIATFTHGIRLENQQWGAEHGLGVDATGIEGIEVIKGPASLLYGSDALGGVLYLVDDRFAPNHTTQVEVGSDYNANTKGIDAYGKVYWSGEKWSVNLSGSQRNHMDYIDGDGNVVNNTRFQTYDFKGKVGYRSKKWSSTLSYNHLDEKYGINEDGDTGGHRDRDLVAPYQPIITDIVSSENIFHLENSKIKLNLGFVRNHRKEIEGEEHDHGDEHGDEHEDEHDHDHGAVAADDDHDHDHEDEHEHEGEEHVGLEMLLQSYTYNLQWIKDFDNSQDQWIVGSQGMYRKNENLSEETLIPNTTTQNIGLFSTYKWGIADRFNMLFGARYDLQKMDSPDAQSEIQNRTDNAFSLSAGFNWSIGERMFIKTNISTGFRAPNIYELASNGSHPSANRYEIGNPNLKKEQAVQLDLSIASKGEHLGWYINPFVNRIQDYIFLTPNGETKENLKVYQYQQSNATLYGGEVGIHYHPHQIHWLHFNSDLSMVYSQDDDGNAIALTPATHINNKLAFDIPTGEKWSLNVYGAYNYTFKQDRVAAYETPTDAYGLVNLGATGRIQWLDRTFVLDLSVNNLFDKAYTSHLSRYKDVGLLNMGRAVQFGVKIPIL